MIKFDEDKNILLTRGDSTEGVFNLPITYENYTFQEDDILTLNVYNKKGYTQSKILTKDTKIIESSDIAYINLSKTDTNKFPLLNKKQTYWYEIVLNDTNTIIGYDEEGAKQLIVYPGGVDDE